MEQKLNTTQAAVAAPKKKDWLTERMNARYGSGNGGTRIAPGFQKEKRKRLPRVENTNKSTQSNKFAKDQNKSVTNRRPEIAQDRKVRKIAPRKFYKPLITEQPKVNLETFEWPQFRTDRERIKYYSQLFKHKEVTDAFEQIFGVQCSHVEAANIVPIELRVGSEFNAKIVQITKDKTIFDVPNAKTSVISAVNLHKFRFFREYLPQKPFRVRVVKIKPDCVVVDPFISMLEEWLNKINTNPNSQKVIGAPQTVLVKNLRSVRGGFIGQASVPDLSNLIQDDYTVDAFIPNSQMVLNLTEDDLSQYEGATVETFALSYSERKSRFGQVQKSLVCSIRELLQFKGNCRLIDFFKGYCENSADWQKMAETTMPGRVTGVINSSKNCGVFVEIPGLNITGMVEMSAEELVNYAPRDEVQVRLVGFEEETYYNDGMDQIQHVDPYTIGENGELVDITIKPVLVLV